MGILKLTPSTSEIRFLGHFTCFSGSETFIPSLSLEVRDLGIQGLLVYKEHLIKELLFLSRTEPQRTMQSSSGLAGQVGRPRGCDAFKSQISLPFIK